MRKNGELVAGLDIGSTKVCCIVGERTADGVDIIGIGTAESRGLRKGVIINIDATVGSIISAIQEAELMAGCEISTVYAGVAGGHVQGFNSNGIVAIKDREVRPSDIFRVIDAAKAVPMPKDRQIIHVLPQEYMVDEQQGIYEPIGMPGVRLEADVHIVTAASSSLQNIAKCASRCDLSIAEVVLEQLASSAAVLTPEEKELGVALIDIGGGTTDIAVWARRSIVHTAVIPIGGNNITKDIAVGLRTPMTDAEKIKIKYGCALTDLVHEDETIEVPTVGDRQPRILSRDVLCTIIEPRVEEMLALINQQLHESGVVEELGSGVVLTGGAAVMEGMPELAQEVLGLPVRRGIPRGVGGLVDVVRNPRFATGVGLVLHGCRAPSAAYIPARTERFTSRIVSRVRRWFQAAV
ncbi:MAG: cell division protein FtsA [Bradymonadales bacterium]|nr:cell division protein FtsA [Bradymonadales bacterium]